jgi:hypothetical protein
VAGGVAQHEVGPRRPLAAPHQPQFGQHGGRRAAPRDEAAHPHGHEAGPRRRGRIRQQGEQAWKAPSRREGCRWKPASAGAAAGSRSLAKANPAAASAATSSTAAKAGP